METRYANLTIFALIAATLGCDYFVDPSLPSIVPSHWNIHGQVDGFSSKKSIYFSGLLPLLIPALVINFLPRLRVPAGMNSSIAIGNYVSAASAVLLCGVNGVILYNILHPGLSLANLIISGVLLFFALIGNVLGKTRRNPWTGIRLPWTLASDANWIATHRFTGRLWVGVSLAGIVLLWLGLPMLILLPVVLVAFIFVPVLYSYLLFKRSGGTREEPA